MAKILTVDDSGFIRTILKNILQEAGYTEIIEAETGKEGIEQYNREKPDLVLLDMILPDMNGLDVLKALNKGGAKVCMVTAVGQDEMITKAKVAGAEDYVTKPFDKETILAVVARNLK